MTIFHESQVNLPAPYTSYLPIIVRVMKQKQQDIKNIHRWLESLEEKQYFSSIIRFFPIVDTDIEKIEVIILVHK